ncbi:hypothetical protein [Bacillus cereus]|uniref:hypothetical protein n=1 Tax=Bacillus cereus TaxID=1396 RepID=UPI00159BCA83|nr:hypothetical protein [Bacillus cereus]
MFRSVLSLGILASTFALTEPAKASTRDDHVNFTFRLWSPDSVRPSGPYIEY